MHSAKQNINSACTRCGASLHDGTPDGLCACCILSAALLAPSEDEAAGLQSPESLLQRRELGGYELIEEIARGGMGVVFRARQRRPERLVALKIITAGELASPRMVQRFHAETEAAARLDHPNIASVYEVGQQDGWHFFSMRLIDGPPLGEKLGKSPMSHRAAAELLVKIARAVHHAHQRGVLHRDIKPNNILLDSAGEPHLTDFGLAKIVESDSDLTHSEAVLGTPAYMPPEQAAGKTRDVTVAADVYSLGAVFYEMLAGRPPFAADTTPGLLRKIVEDEPDPPSQARRQSKAGAAQGLGENGARELDIICLKCLEKHPERRYASAAELADDVERWLRGEPILAQASGVGGRFVKWVRRKPALTALIGLLALSTAAVIFVSLAYNFQLTLARQRAEDSEGESRRRLLSQHLREQARLTGADDAYLGALSLTEALRVPGIGQATRQKLQERLEATITLSPRLVRAWNAGGSPSSLQFSKNGAYAIATMQDGGCRVWDLATRHAVTNPETSSRKPIASAVSGDGERIIQLFEQEPFGQVWDLGSRRTDKLATATSPGSFTAFSPDGRWIATCGPTVQLWEASSGKLSSALKSALPVVWAGFSPDGHWLLAGHTNETVSRWNMETLEQAKGFLPGEAPWIAPVFSGDGKWALTTATGTVHLVELATGDVRFKIPVGNRIFGASLSPDGQTFATASFREQARVWSTETGRMIRLPIVHESGVNIAVFSPDARLLVTAGFDHSLRICNVTDHRPVAPIIHHGSFISAVAFSADCRFLAVGGVDGLVQIWDLETALKPILAAGKAPRRLTTSADGGRLVFDEQNGLIRVCHVGSMGDEGESLSVPEVPSQAVFDASGRYLAAACGAGGVLIWDLNEHRLLQRIRNASAFNGIVFSPDAAELATSTSEGAIQRWDVRTGKSKGERMARGESAAFIYWSGNGKWISAGGGESIQVWDATTCKPAAKPILEKGQNMEDCRFSPDGENLLAVFSNLSIEPAAAHVYALPGLQLVGKPLQHADGVSSGSFSADGMKVATGGEDNVARIWRVKTGEPITGALRHKGIVREVRFRGDGEMLATGSVDGMMRLWDAERGELIAPPLQFGGTVGSLAFSRDGRRLVVSGPTLASWIVELGPKKLPSEALELTAECQSGMRTDAERGFTPIPVDELSVLFERLCAISPKESVWVARSPQWHLQTAAVAERQGQWFAAAYHLQMLVTEQPNNKSLARRLVLARERCQ